MKLSQAESQVTAAQKTMIEIQRPPSSSFHSKEVLRPLLPLNVWPERLRYAITTLKNTDKLCKHHLPKPSTSWCMSRNPSPSQGSPAFASGPLSILQSFWLYSRKISTSLPGDSVVLQLVAKPSQKARQKR